MSSKIAIKFDGKTIVTFGFVILVTIALGTYLGIRGPSIRQNLGQPEMHSTPRVILEDFDFSRYVGNVKTSSTKGKTAEFFEPNRIEISGGFIGDRLNKNSKLETVEGKKAKAEFEASNLNQMMNHAKLVRSVAEGDVVMFFDNHKLFSDYVEYFAVLDSLNSKQPVSIIGEGRSMKSRNGFNYELKKQTLIMEGSIEGEILNR